MYYFLGAPSTNGQKNRTQLERNFAQLERNFAQLKRNLNKYSTLKNTLARSFTFLEGDHFFLWNVVEIVETTTVQLVSLFSSTNGRPGSVYIYIYISHTHCDDSWHWERLS